MFPCARIHCQRSKCVSQASDQEIQEEPEEMHEWSQPELNQKKMTIPNPGMQGATWLSNLLKNGSYISNMEDES